MDFNSLFESESDLDRNDTVLLYELDPIVVAKEVAMFQAQAQSLCSSQGSVRGDGPLLAAERRHLRHAEYATHQHIGGARS